MPKNPFVTVKQAAVELLCTPRRVRVLLVQGRLLGAFDAAAGVWQVNHPLRLRPGRRGPLMKCKQPPKASGMAQRSAAIKTAGERQEVCGKGDAREAV